MKEYHKIQTVYLRDPENNHKTLLEGTWAKPEFELLRDVDWMCTEKIDGTNIRIMREAESNNVSFAGKTDRAEIPKHLKEKLETIISSKKINYMFQDTENVCLYGEGYGEKIQKGGNYIPDDVGFILFDVKVDRWWLKRRDVEEIAKELKIPVVPIIGVMKLEEAVKIVKNGFKSTISHNENYLAEGLIMKPVIELFDRGGHRVITKIKHKDFSN